MNWFIYCLRHYVTFEGRAARPEYWFFALGAFLSFVAVSLVDGAMGTFVGAAGMGMLGGLLMLALALPSLAAGARRLHDTGLSGWWQLLNLIPWIGWIVVIVLLARPGMSEANRFGAVPTHSADSPATGQG